jgi:hypothetical protein
MKTQAEKLRLNPVGSEVTRFSGQAADKHEKCQIKGKGVKRGNVMEKTKGNEK